MIVKFVFWNIESHVSTISQSLDVFGYAQKRKLVETAEIAAQKHGNVGIVWFTGPVPNPVT